VSGVQLVDRLEQDRFGIGVVLVAFAVNLLVGGEFVRAPFTIAWYLSFGTNIAWQTIFLVVQLRTASERLAAYAHDRSALLVETRRDALTGLLNRREFKAHFAEAPTECSLGNVPVAPNSANTQKAYHSGPTPRLTARAHTRPKTPTR